MKCLIFVLSIFAVITHSYCIPDYIQECLAENKVEKDAPNPVINVNNPQLKCFNACILKKSGMMKNGKIDRNSQFEMLKQFSRLSLGDLKDKVNNCAAAANKLTDECDVASEMKRCLLGNIRRET